MRGWLMTLLDLSLAASLMVWIVLLFRLALRPLSRKYFYLLWSAVFIRAVCPFSYSSPFSAFRFFSFMRTKGSQLTFSPEPYQAARLSGLLGPGDAASQAGGAASSAAAGAAAAAGTGTGAQTGALAAQAAAGGNMLPQILFGLWAAGVVLLLAWGLFSWLRLRRRTAAAIGTEEGICETDRISTAFVLGFFRPGIYLPAGLAGQKREFVLRHEKIHVKRHDHQFKMLAWLIVVLHWFNPLLWLSFALLARDMEMSCDERVLEAVGEEQKENYGEFLLSLAVPGGFPAGSPLAFGESSVKARIRNVLKYKKKKRAAVTAALLLVLAGLLFCLSNPSGQEAVDIIGGADGPTSIFIRGEMDLSAEDASASEEERFLQKWAEAAGHRDAAAVYEMLSPELQARAEELGIERAADENGEEVLTMGWSSPYLAADPVITVHAGLDAEDNVISLTAEITYPALTSEPLWYVWKDYLTLERDGDAYQVSGWERRTFFEFASLAEIQEAYRDWTPDYYEPVDGNRSAADWLIYHDLEGTNPEYYGTVFSTPVRALEETLHVSGGTSETKMQEDGSAIVTYRFADTAIRVRMIQPGLSEGSEIWLPDDGEINM